MLPRAVLALYAVFADLHPQALGQWLVAAALRIGDGLLLDSAETQ